MSNVLRKKPIGNISLANLIDIYTIFVLICVANFSGCQYLNEVVSLKLVFTLEWNKCSIPTLKSYDFRLDIDFLKNVSCGLCSKMYYRKYVSFPKGHFQFFFTNAKKENIFFDKGFVKIISSLKLFCIISYVYKKWPDYLKLILYYRIYSIILCF
jgi:hypothetical protein